jgi:hypothetical protein
MLSVSPWEVLFVPASLALIYSLLFVVSWFEQRVLSPRSMILHSARSRAAQPEQVEALVTDLAQRLLDRLSDTAPPPTRQPSPPHGRSSQAPPPQAPAAQRPAPQRPSAQRPFDQDPTDS